MIFCTLIFFVKGLKIPSSVKILLNKKTKKPTVIGCERYKNLSKEEKKKQIARIWSLTIQKSSRA